jgi:hypothetical protein
LAFGLGIALAALAVGASYQTAPLWRFNISIVVMLIAVVLLPLGGLIAVARRLPGWGYTWVGAGLMGVFLVLFMLGDDREFLISPASDAAVAVLLLLAGVVALGAAALRGWQQAGLVSLGLSATLGLSLCFFVTAGPFSRYDLGLLAAPLGGLVAALVYAYVRGTNLTRVAVLADMGFVDAGVLWMAEQVWNPWFASHGQPHSYLPLRVFLMAPLMVGPLVGLAGRPLRRVIERA